MAKFLVLVIFVIFCLDKEVETCSWKTNKGECCVLPFIYLGKSYSSCIGNDNNNIPWCSTTNNYDKDKRWGNCKPAAEETCKLKTENGECCAFPFIYKGKSYSSCVNGRTPWCSTTHNYDTDYKWDNCKLAAEKTTCKWETVKDECCALPFIYKGKTYSSCTGYDNGGTLWCSTTNNYDKDHKWGNCKPGEICSKTTVKGELCAFPFIYEKKSYSGCTTVNNGDTPWCSTTHNHDIDHKGGNCKLFAF